MKIIGEGILWRREGITYIARNLLYELSKSNQVFLNSLAPRQMWHEYPDLAEAYQAFNPNKEEHILIKEGWPTHWGLSEYMRNNRKFVGLSVFEGSKIPELWKENMNLPHVRQIWVPSEYCLRQYANSGVDKSKLRYMPPGLMPCFKPFKGEFWQKYTSTRNMSDKFVFFGMGAIHGVSKRDRKGMDLLIQAFTSEFKNESDVFLVLKINTLYAKNLANAYTGKDFNLSSYLQQFYSDGNKNIVILEQEPSNEVLAELYNSVNCAVFPSRAEGFSLCAAETIACGIPTISTGYSAPTEFTDPRLQVKVNEMKLAEFDTEEQQRYPYQGVKWAEPSLTHLKQLMRYVYENYETEKKIALEFSSKIREKYTWSKSAEIANRLLSEL